MTLLEQVFKKDNIQQSARTVEESIRASKSKKTHRGKKALEQAISVSKDPNLFIDSEQAAWESDEAPAIKRFIKAIPKKRGGVPERPISLFEVYDRILFRAVLNIVWPVIEPHIVPSVCFCTYKKDGQHPPRGIVEAVKFVSQQRATKSPYLKKIDISAFFDTIDRSLLHALIVSWLPDDSLNLFIERFLNCEATLSSSFPAELKIDTTLGIPQGASLSPLLACSYLCPFDHEVERAEISMLRYVDDILIFSTSEEEREVSSLKITDLLLSTYKLKTKERKTTPVNPSERLEFLGHYIYPDGVLMPNQNRYNGVVHGIYQRVNRLPELGNSRVSEELSSYILGFINSNTHCALTDKDFSALALIVKRALRSRHLNEDRLTRVLIRASKKWPKAFLEALNE